MLLYELVILLVDDPVFNPVWRQGALLVPFSSKLGVVSSTFGWSVSSLACEYSAWSFESVVISHMLLAGLLSLSSIWHWSYWDLDLFILARTGNLSLDLLKIFGIHLLLASSLCFGFGILHLTVYGGPGYWSSDTYGMLGSIRYVKPVFSIIALVANSYGSLSSHHIGAGLLGIIVSLWHISSRPGVSVFKLLCMGNIEIVLSTSIAAVLTASSIVSSISWYGSIICPIELYSPTRFQWDNGYFSLSIESRVNITAGKFKQFSWDLIPDKLLFYDYLGNNPSKGGLFRSGPMLLSSGLVQNWVGEPSYIQGTQSLYVRRMPTFFETFPVLLVDSSGTVRSDIPFRRADSRFSIEQLGCLCKFRGGLLDGAVYQSASTVKSYARKSQYGRIFSFDKRTLLVDGVFRTTIRGWLSFSHIILGLLFIFGHLWHSSRTFFKDIWTGITLTSSNIEKIEYGRYEKLGTVEEDTYSMI
jgi:photosystem II CP47 chlorophyll apoprotein